MSKPTTIDDFSFLSDEDVKLLYDIITTAEASSETPFRALFAAYDQVLTKYGIARDYDQVYFRFLLHMGEGRREGEGLFERFESLLAKLGLQIDFVEDGEEKGRDGEEQDTRGTAARIHGRSANDDTRKLTRRVSFDSAYETNAESKRVIGANAPASTPRPHSTDIIQRALPQEPHKPAKSTIPHSIHNTQKPNGITKLSTRGRVKSREAPELEGVHQPRRIALSRSRERSQSQQQHNLRKSRGSDPEGASITSGEDSDVESALDQARNIDAQLDLFPQPRSTVLDVQQMELHAKTLRYHHLAAQAISHFRHWRRRAHQSINENQRLLSIAVVRDVETLSRQAFDQWRSALLQKQHIKETERIFEALELKSTQARNLFLLTKAFTHWAQCTSDEVSRKSAARRHILQTRYFNAWREISVVNELKVRRQGLHKFMSVWKRRTAQAIRQQKTAVYFFQRKCTDRFYREWFWQFCDRRAPIWYTSKLKGGLFSKWVDATRQAQILKTWAVESRSLELLRCSMVTWTNRASLARQHADEAGIFRRRKLLQRPIEALHKEVTYAPLRSQVVRVVDCRVVRSAFTAWHTKSCHVFESARINSLRTKRNAWTAWNDRLRCQALTRKIDDRVVLQALYKWVLVERLALFRRVRDEKTRKTFLCSWRNKMTDLFAALGHAKHTLRQSRDRKARITIINKWAALSRIETQRQSLAQEFRARLLTTQTVRLWINKLRHIRTLETYSTDARFYVLASTSLSRWRAATITNARTKRREAYSKLRRKAKTTTARKILLNWRDNAAALTQMKQQATSLDQTRLLHLGTSLFHTWRTRTHDHHSATTQAHTLHSLHLSRTHFTHLTTAHTTLQTASLRASAFLADSTASAAAACLRKLNWQLFQLRRQGETASSLEERSRRRHYRGMVRYWAERTRERKRPTERVLFLSPAGGGGGTPLTDARVRLLDLNAGGGTSQVPRFAAFTTTPFLPPPLPLPAPAPIPTPTTIPSTPGYLRTPSRHRHSQFQTQTRTQTQTQTRGFTSSVARRPLFSQSLQPQTHAQPMTPFPATSRTGTQTQTQMRQGGAGYSTDVRGAGSRFRRGVGGGVDVEFGRSFLGAGGRVGEGRGDFVHEGEGRISELADYGEGGGEDEEEEEEGRPFGPSAAR